MNTKKLKLALIILLTGILGVSVSYAKKTRSSYSSKKATVVYPYNHSQLKGNTSSGNSFKQTSRYNTPPPSEDSGRYNKNDHYKKNKKEKDYKTERNWKVFRKSMPVYWFYQSLEPKEDKKKEEKEEYYVPKGYKEDKSGPSSAPDTDEKLNTYCRSLYNEGKETYSGSVNVVYYAYQALPPTCQGWFGPAPVKKPEKKNTLKNTLRSPTAGELSERLARSPEAIGTGILRYINPPKKSTPSKSVSSSSSSSSSRSNNSYYSFHGKSTSSSWYKAPKITGFKSIKTSRSPWRR